MTEGSSHDTHAPVQDRPANGLEFELLTTDGHARRGRVKLNHGTVETPIFMPVGTYGTVKAIQPRELHEIKARSSSATRSTCGCARASTRSTRTAACTASWAGTSRS